MILLCVSVILKRNTNILRIILASLFGGLSVIFLFIKVSSLELFLFKIIISIGMILITFKYKNIKYTINNFIYLYLVSIILGGFLYIINDSLSYKSNGFIFYHNGTSINWLIVIVLTPITLFLYIHQTRKLKDEYSKKYSVEITFLNGFVARIMGFIDTGNNLIDPYKKRPILVINKKILNNYKPRTILVPCKTVNKDSVIKCFKIKKLVINNKLISQEVLIGISDNNLNIEDVDLLLHRKVMEEINENNN